MSQTQRPLPQGLPEVIFQDQPSLERFHRRAWELAYDHVISYEGAPTSPYMDEAHTSGTIWIWDTCFMALFCKYAPEHFPGVESLENFYAPIHEQKNSSLKIHHLDNPPLFAWVEWMDAQHTGRKERLQALHDRKVLQKHFELVENLPTNYDCPNTKNENFLKRVEHGYHWAGCPNGMDNTPRGGGGKAPTPGIPDDSRHGYPDILWLDALAQQALSAECIANIAQSLGDTQEEQSYRAIHRQKTELLQTYYWNEEDGIFYDILAKDPKQQYKVKTPACYWPMLAGMVTEQQAERLAAHLTDPEIFGGDIPLPSVARNEPSYDPKGGYWRGGVWLPLAYMSIKALERYGFQELADQTSQNLIQHMLKTWEDFEPATIWEAYSPSEAMPSTHKQSHRLARPDFCGWSALGPISLLIENHIGLRVDPNEDRSIIWNLQHSGVHGIKNFNFQGVHCKLMYDGQGQIEIETNAPFKLSVKNKSFKLTKGQQSIRVSTSS